MIFTAFSELELIRHFSLHIYLGISHQDPISEREHRRMTMNVHFDDDDDEFQSDESDEEDVFPRIRQDRLSAQQRRWQSTQDSGNCTRLYTFSAILLTFNLCHSSYQVVMLDVIRLSCQGDF